MTPEEMRTSQRMFAKFDVDGDGVVSRDDFAAAMTALERRVTQPFNSVLAPAFTRRRRRSKWHRRRKRS